MTPFWGSTKTHFSVKPQSSLLGGSTRTYVDRSKIGISKSEGKRHDSGCTTGVPDAYGEKGYLGLGSECATNRINSGPIVQIFSVSASPTMSQ